MTTATHNQHDTTPERVLCMAFELREKTWKLGFTTGHGQKPRERIVAARHQARLLQEVADAKKRCGLPETAPVVSCYEAGRESFWLHRFLQSPGITNHVVDSSSIAVNRRKRRAKSDALDVRKLVRMLMRYAQGEREGWRVVHMPSPNPHPHHACGNFPGGNRCTAPNSSLSSISPAKRSFTFDSPHRIRR